MAEDGDAGDVISSYPFGGDDGASDEETYVCSDCDREFETERGLNIHRGQQHERNGG